MVTRSELGKQLSVLTRAKGYGESLPVFRSVYFYENVASIYDGNIAVEIPSDLGAIGGVDCDSLQKWVNGKKADTEVSYSGGYFKNARSKIRLPVLSMDQPPYGDEEEGIPSGVDPGEFVSALRWCSLCVGKDISVPSFAGVSCSISGGTMTMYSTDNVMMATATIDASGPDRPCSSERPDQTFILSPKTVDLIISTDKTYNLESFVIHKRWTESFFAEDVSICARMLSGPDIEKYKLMQDRFEGADSFPIDDTDLDLKAAAKTLGNASVLLSARGGELTVTGGTDFVDVEESLDIAPTNFTGHTRVMASSLFKALTASVGQSRTLALLHDAAIISVEDHSTYYISAVS